MTPEQIHKKLQAKFGNGILEFNADAFDPFIQIEPEKISDVAVFLRDEPDLDFKALMCLSGIDYGAESNLGVVYNLHSIQYNHKITVRVDLPREKPKLLSVETVWRTADWHEREAFDLYGIHFEGHRDLRRILCPDDWEGYPLRKDYIVQEYYHGVRVPYQEDWSKFETMQKNPGRGNFVFKVEPRVPDLVTGNGKPEENKNG